LIYVLAHPSKEARDQAFKAFGADPEWKKVVKESEADGKLVSKVDVQFLTATDYSPSIQPTSAGERIFELRTYTASPNNLDNLNARFRDHTLKLFEKHGMTNVAYWVLAKDQKGADVTLIYLLAHKNGDAAKASFDAFRKDPDWVAARKA
jgi:NIPSNAP